MMLRVHSVKVGSMDQYYKKTASILNSWVRLGEERLKQTESEYRLCRLKQSESNKLEHSKSQTVDHVLKLIPVCFKLTDLTRKNKRLC